MTSVSLQNAKTHLASVLECDPADLTDDDTIETVEKWDSLNHMRLVLHLEDVIGRQIEPDDTMTLFTVQAIADFLIKAGAD
ncbi:MAG: acyl carrier protein [Sneathiella sp.]